MADTKKKVAPKNEFDPKDLCYSKKSGWSEITEKNLKEIMDFAEGYKEFLTKAKTEREAVKTIYEQAKAKGYKCICEATAKDKKIFINFDNVACVLAEINDTSFKNGWLMVGSHIDTPRLDLKGYPLYEKEDMAYFKTHYYGGIKKYQWVTRPLALHGVVVKEDGTTVDIVIGEDDNDPVFTVNDLLIHLAQEQMEKSARKVIEGENLNILIGSIPYKFKYDKDSVKLAILDMLYKKYGFKEEDFVSAELQVVPAGKARDVGLDRSFVGSHGQDDRICAYCAMQAIFDSGKSNQNKIAMFFDKEEIGSKGNAGANSNILERAVNKLINLYGKGDYNTLINSLADSKFLSSDVNAGIEPEWAGVFEPMNAGKVGWGVCLTKFTGAGGKGNSNEAHAEFVAKCRAAFNKDNARWQTAELGKVDCGGGGTIAMFIAEYGMDVLDVGTAILSMHSPFEVSSKADLYNTYLAYRAFYKYL
ncbi:aminopeptidase [bacterium]|nr:aminopeptidase [bacterium]